jgi:ribokinase
VTGGPVRTAVVGHVEWAEFAVVERLPAPGEIVHARESFRLAAGGGAVAAVQLAGLGGQSVFVTAVGEDPDGDAALADLEDRGVSCRALRRGTTRRVFTFLADDHERTITVLGERLVPHGADAVDWGLGACGAAYFTGGDVVALRHARRARVLVATPRALDTLSAAGVELDVLVHSASDPGEQVPPGALDPEPRVVVRTEGADGGAWEAADGRRGRWEACSLPGPPVDAYGCGDAFAAGLTHGLAAGEDLDGALALGARCGAHVLCGRGPFAGMLRLPGGASRGGG